MSAVRSSIRSVRKLAGAFLRRHRHYLVEVPGTGLGFGAMADPHTRLHFSRIYLGDAANAVARRRWQGRSRMQVARSIAERHGLVVFAASESPDPSAGECLQVPRYVSLKLGSGASDEAFFASLPTPRRRQVRRALERGFRCEISTDPGWAVEFHDRFHAPSVRDRHGEEGYVMPPAEIAAAVGSGAAEFLKVLVDGRCVHASTRYPGRGFYHMGRTGWLDGDPRWIAMGAQTACVWFTAARARKLGLPQIAMGGSPGYLTDGVFTYKMRWGAELDPANTVWGDHYLLLDPRHPSVHRFLANHPFLARNPAGHFVAYSTQPPEHVPITPGIRSGLAAWYQLRGQSPAPASGPAWQELDPAPDKAPEEGLIGGKRTGPAGRPLFPGTADPGAAGSDR